MSVPDDSLPAGHPFRPDLELTPRQAHALLSREHGLLLIDCRTPQEWAVARVEGSVHIPLDELPDRTDEVEDAIAADESRPVAVLCHHGVRSLKAALFLRQRGIEAKSVAGGIEQWSVAVDPSVPRYERGPGGCRPLGG